MNSNKARSLVQGTTSGRLLWSAVGLSFWGGVDISTGQVVDRQHPLCGALLLDCILAIPSGRGSCTGSGAILELLASGKGPAGLIFHEAEDILTLGVLVAKAIFDVSIPVIKVTETDFLSLQGYEHASIDYDRVTVSAEGSTKRFPISEGTAGPIDVVLSTKDRQLLNGQYGSARKLAMEILVNFAQVQGAKELVDVTQSHVDACIYIGPAGLKFAQTLVSSGGRFMVPTTLNSISIDRRRWKELGLTKEQAHPAENLAKACMDMGAQVSFTCAPYLLESAPKAGEQIGWAESNAVVYANSVLGARTQKYPDFLDVCIAMTGRAPLSGCHRDENRLPTMLVTLPSLVKIDSAAYSMIGYCIGKLVGPNIPFIEGFETASPGIPDLKAFGAGFATSSSAPMFHMRGVTPESGQVERYISSLRHVTISDTDLTACRQTLNTASDSSVDLVSLGNPHFSIEEFADLASLCAGRKKHSRIRIVVTTSRYIQQKAEASGYLQGLMDFGVDVITDTCWCMIDEPVIPPSTHNIMTNSAKYAHYAPGMVKRGIHFGSLQQCVEAACTGQNDGWAH